MSIRRVVQIVAFVTALAFAFAGPVTSGTAWACTPTDTGGFCP